MSNATLSKKLPYAGFHAKVTIKKNSFCIEDNCGGIPWELRAKAFRIGRVRAEEAPKSPSNALMVGAYGIGMKRAVFKLGRQALIQTKTTKDAYEVEVPKGWMDDEGSWNLSTRAAKTQLPANGTKLEVTSLVSDVAATFGEEVFQKSLYEMIATHFAIIIGKGFAVTLSFFGAEILVKPKSVTLHFQEQVPRKGQEEIRPYVFRSETEDDVEVTVFIGLREPIPDAEAQLSGQDDPKYSTDYAGITVICNDRVVLYCNRDELTGWGTARVPSYHTQFIAISGYVEFRGDPAKLPTTTTKRGLEYSSRQYQQVLDRIREGLRMYIDYTNWWKSNEGEAKRQVAKTAALSFADLKARISDSSKVKMTPVRTGMVGQQYRPTLPRPKEDASELRVSFYRPKDDVLRLAESRLKTFDQLPISIIPRTLGEELFDSALKKIS